MTSKYLLKIAPKAQQAIEERASYIEEQSSPFAAQFYVSGLYAFIDKHLSHNPYIYQSREDLKAGLNLRIAYYKKTTAIIYIVEESSKIVIVTGIRHTRENYINNI